MTTKKKAPAMARTAVRASKDRYIVTYICEQADEIVAGFIGEEDGGVVGTKEEAESFVYDALRSGRPDVKVYKVVEVKYKDTPPVPGKATIVD